MANELEGLSVDTGEQIGTVSHRIQEMIMAAILPETLGTEMMSAYSEVEKKAGQGVHMAVRSSAIREDTEASFAGKYSPRAISYRMHHGLGDRETPMCVAAIVMLGPMALYPEPG